MCPLKRLLLRGKDDEINGQLPSGTTPCDCFDSHGTTTVQQRATAKAVIDWPEFRFDLCHTGYNRYEFVLSPATVWEPRSRLEVHDGGRDLRYFAFWSVLEPTSKMAQTAGSV